MIIGKAGMSSSTIYLPTDFPQDKFWKPREAMPFYRAKQRYSQAENHIALLEFYGGERITIAGTLVGFAPKVWYVAEYYDGIRHAGQKDWYYDLLDLGDVVERLLGKI